MTPREYPYFHFDPIYPNLLREKFTEHGDVFLSAAYAEWIRSFASKSQVFYHVQVINHERHLWRSFCFEQGLDADIAAYDYGEDTANDFEDYCDAHGLFYHEQIADRIRKATWDLVSYYNPDRSLYSTSDDIAKRLLEIYQHAHDGKPHPYTFRRNVDALWFDTVVANNDDSKSQELRSMAYPDFLKTTYWRRVRAAMLLMHRARCQGHLCANGEDGHWFGDEFYMHVHHMHYKNRGRERFDDLRLVCDVCHKRIHNGEIDAVLPYKEVNIVKG